MFIPWQIETIWSNWEDVSNLLKYSFMPDTLENGLSSEILSHTYSSLSSTSTCKVCDLLDTLITSKSPSVEFYEDYAFLCFHVNNAPRTWISSIMAATDFIEILRRHFGDSSNYLDLSFHPHSLLGIDIQLHFFINQCFNAVNSTELIYKSNIGYFKIEFLRAILTGQGPSTFCFKTMWPKDMQTWQVNNRDTKPYKHSPKSTSCCNLVSRNTGTVKNSLDMTDKFQDSLHYSTEDKLKHSLLPFFYNVWKDSDLFKTVQNTSNEPQIDYFVQNNSQDSLTFFTQCIPSFQYPENSDHEQGPCLLAPMLGLKKKNLTSSICILCECVAAHQEAREALEKFKNEVLNSFGNNIKLLDRIYFSLKHKNYNLEVQDPILQEMFKICKAQEFYKHMFADPLCALNSLICNPRVLFFHPNVNTLKIFKAAIATGVNLNPPICDALVTLTYIFKSIQVAKLGKTTIIDIVKELDLLLKLHNIDIVQSFQTSQLYI